MATRVRALVLIRIEESANRLVIRDTPAGQWLFGAVFMISGLVVLTIPFSSDAWRGFELWQKLAVLAIGLGHLTIGTWYVLRHVETIVTFDRINGNARAIQRRPFSSREQITEFKVVDARAIEIRRSLDNDGDPMCQLVLWLSGSRALPLQGQPTHQRQRTETTAAALRRALALPEGVPKET